MSPDSLSSPKVSVVIPVYNCENYLAEAIESVIAQTLAPDEIIIVDDGSTDRSAEVARRYLPHVIYCYQPNGGIGAARNRGIGMARGDFIAHLDSDDIWTEDKLKLSIEAFESHPEADMVSGQVRQFYSPDLDEDFRKSIACPDKAMPGYIPSAMVVRKVSFFKVGFYETGWEIAHDMSWYMRAMEEGLRLHIMPELVLMRRIHRNNIGIRKRDFRNQRLHILKAALDRRRRIVPGGG